MNRSYRKSTLYTLFGLFALTFTLSVAFGTYLPSYSQPSNLSPREALIEEIREDVARHIEIRGEALSHSDIKDYYLDKAQTAGLTDQELIEIYEQAYLEQKQTQQPQPWEKFIPNVGWLFGIASMAVLAYVTVLQSWINARVKAVNDWLYGKLSGTRLFRRVALRKYRAALGQGYGQLPMPFLKNRDPLRMDDVYVPLKVSAGKKEERERNTVSVIKQEQIDAYQAIADHRCLMVIGEPGSGKSILLKYLAWSYGLGKLEGLTDRPIVVLLELYRLSDGSLDEAKLIQALVDVFDRNHFPNAKQFILQGLQNGLFLLLFDGLDEVNSDVRTHVVGVIRDLLKKYSRCRTVITCRTAVYEGEFSDIVDRKLEVVEFTDQQMQRFLKAWNVEMQRAKKSINQMMAALRERPLILKLARNPLLLTLIAYLYTEPAFVLPRSRAEFYKKSTGILLEQREYKGDDDYKHNIYKADEKRSILQHLALYAQDNSPNLKDRRSIKAEIIRERVKAVLPSLDIPKDEAKEVLEEIVERSGLFMKIDGGERYIFPHLTIQEYFAAAALEGQETELIRQFEADPTAWREVVKLWCSLANESTSLVKAIYQRDAITGLECLAEARQVDQDLANQIIEQFKPRLDQPQSDDTLTRAFGSVAANDRARGKAVFDFLAATLHDPNASNLRHNAAADALSRTNLPKAANVLIDWYGDYSFIVRMGDLAVPRLAKLAQQGKLQVQDDLYAIGTPDAAIALVPLLWSQAVDISSRAAWYLGGLLPQPEIAEALREYELTDQQKQEENLGWIWQPFGEPSHSALPIIAGRIAYLLHLHPLQTIRKIPPALDPRLVVPICAIQFRLSGLPNTFPASAETLLEQPDESSQQDNAYLDAIHKLLENSQNISIHWRQLIAALPPRVELDLLRRLIQQRQHNRSHWQNLFQMVDYEMRTGWHYRGILLLSALLTVTAIFKVGFTIAINPEAPLFAGFAVAIVPIFSVFWLAVWRGIDSTLQPELFWELGPKGGFTYFLQYNQLFRQGLIWSGVDALYKSVTDRWLANIAVAFVVAFAVAVAVAVAGAV